MYYVLHADYWKICKIKINVACRVHNSRKRIEKNEHMIFCTCSICFFSLFRVEKCIKMVMKDENEKRMP